MQYFVALLPCVVNLEEARGDVTIDSTTTTDAFPFSSYDRSILVLYDEVKI